MSNVGGGFAQGYAQTLATMGPVLEQINERKQTLEIQRKGADAALKLHEAQTAALTHKTAVGLKLRARLLESELAENFGDVGGASDPSRTYALRLPADLERSRPLLAELAISDPDTVGRAVIESMKPHTRFASTPTGGVLNVYTGETRENPNALTVESLPRLLREIEGGGAVAAGAPSRTAAPAGPIAEPSATPAMPGLAPQRRIQSMTLNKDGSFTLQIGNLRYSEHFTQLEMPPGSGSFQQVRVVSNPENPSQAQVFPMGPAMPAAEIQRLDAAVETIVPRSSPFFGAAKADLAALAMTEPEAKRPFVMNALRSKYAALQRVAPQGSATAPPASALNVSETARVRQQESEAHGAALRAKAVKEAEQSVPERASPSERKEMAQSLTSIDAVNTIAALYKPAFVGPVRGRAGAAGERAGVISRQESEFRTQNAAMRNQVIKDITGAQMSEPEAQRIMAQLPDETLPPAMFEARLKVTKVNAKILAMRRRQVLEATGVDVSKLPRVYLTGDEKLTVSAPITFDYRTGQLPREAAKRQLMGLAQFTDREADAFLTTVDKARN